MFRLSVFRTRVTKDCGALEQEVDEERAFIVYIEPWKTWGCRRAAEGSHKDSCAGRANYNLTVYSWH